MVVKNDSTLPQEDPHKKQRLDELARKKDIYQLEKKFDGQLAIPQVNKIKKEEEGDLFMLRMKFVLADSLAFEECFILFFNTGQGVAGRAGVFEQIFRKSIWICKTKYY